MGQHADDKKVQDLHKVLQITRSMAATSDLDELLRLIMERSMELLDAERATIWLYDAAKEELVSRVAAGVGEIRTPADRGISGATIRTRSTTIVPDVYADDRWNPEVDRRTGYRTRNLLSVPLSDHEGRLVGVLQVVNKRSGGFEAYDVTLAETLAAQAGVALQRANLIEHYLQKQQMQRAMKIARDIQRNLLPKRSPSIEGFDVAGFSEAADETGGDIYDFLSLPGGRCGLIVADASGHGIGPALVIAETRAMLRATSLQEGVDLSVVLATVNNLLVADLGEARFVTCFFGVLDPAISRLTYASAGHGPMLFYRRRSDTFQEVPATGLPLGILEETDYGTVIEHDLQPGDFAAIMTDGFLEAVNPRGEQFGVERMTELLRCDRDEPAEKMIRDMHAHVLGFMAGQPQADDLTAVIVRKAP